MHPRRRSLIGPLILITLGFMLLLANLGYLPQSFWELAFRFWPLILILIGLEIIFGRRSAFAALVIVALWVLIVAGILWLSFGQGGALPAASLTPDSVSQPLGEIKSAVVNLNLGLSATTVNALTADSTDLVKGTYSRAQGMQLAKNYEVAGTEGRLTLKEEGNILAGAVTSRLDLALNPQVPIKLNVNGGVGRATVDLSGLNVSTMDINAGVGTLSITTPKTGEMKLRVDGGVGSLQITIPPGVAARIRVNTGIGGTNVDTSRFVKSGEYYQSADYTSATNKIDLDVNGGVGAIKIR